jgi:hypothetical protein
MLRFTNVGLGLAVVAGSLGPAPAQAQAADPCGGQPNCAATRGFTATITNFRPSTVDVRTKAIAITMRFENRTNQPLILGYINDSGIITDDQGQRYVTHPAGVRGNGVIATQFDPKLVQRPGEASDARFEMVLRLTGANPLLGT